MNEIKQIREYLKQNQKIIRFASESISMDSFDENVIRSYNETKEVLKDYEVSLNGARIKFEGLKAGANESLIKIGSDIIASVKAKDVVSELNTRLKISERGIDCTSKKFYCDTKNFKVTDNQLYFNGEVRGKQCNIGGFDIAGKQIKGKASVFFEAGTINAKNMELRHAIAGYIDCNPNNEEGKIVNLTSAYHYYRGKLDSTATVVTGLNVVGDVYALHSWDQTSDSHGIMQGTDFSVWMGSMSCKAIVLRAEDGSFSTANRLRCNYIYSVLADEEWSDRNLKEDIKNIDVTKTERLWEKLEPKKFTVKKTGQQAIGYIAQDVKRALESAGLKGIIEEENGMYALRYDSLIPFRILQIQENEKKIRKIRRLRDGRKH